MWRGEGNHLNVRLSDKESILAPPFETMELPRVGFPQAPNGQAGARAAHGPAGLQGAPGDHWDAMEPEWIRRAQQGDREAFERLMQFHDPCVRRVIAAIMHPRFGRCEERGSRLL